MTDKPRTWTLHVSPDGWIPRTITPTTKAVTVIELELVLDLLESLETPAEAMAVTAEDSAELTAAEEMRRELLREHGRPK